MWELIVELEENKDMFFNYEFESFERLTDFIFYNETYNVDHCKYCIEKSN